MMCFMVWRSDQSEFARTKRKQTIKAGVNFKTTVETGLQLEIFTSNVISHKHIVKIGIREGAIYGTTSSSRVVSR